MDNSNFIEIQQFRQGWLLALVLVPCISALIYIGFKVFRNWPMSGTYTLIYGAIILALDISTGISYVCNEDGDRSKK